MKKLVFLTLVTLLLAGGVFAGGTASGAAASTPKILEFDTMAGVPRPYTGSANAIRGINGGGFPWVVSAASGELRTDGRLEIEVRGLVIDPNDPDAINAGVAGTNPAASFKAIVSCLTKDNSGAATTMNVATGTFPATPTGDSSIEATVTLPQPCIAPIVFVTSPGGSWFAATGN